MHSKATSKRNHFFTIVFFLTGLSWLSTPPPALAISTLPANSNLIIFLDTDDPGSLPNFTGFMITGAGGIIIDFQLTMNATVLDFSASGIPGDNDQVFGNDSNNFSIIDTTAPPLIPTNGVLQLFDDGGWSGTWFFPRTFCPSDEPTPGPPACTWSVAAVPEPSTLFLVGAGLLFLLRKGRRSLSH